ncbi:amino acid ABC transporter substrate-binding protein [Microbacterium saccharophilum]|uniref:Amino acid ABC transporter substrate-binding protein n=1 Tax=Microbacterium saccharophilum TaxID=1213358 RepID=A0A5C8HZU6_9MICO|nr:transporter substrate-binding domain-containing protein [Microbacterium saccharophilum]TXK10594.1 amino acid ABC transporter substrate-binding protein [Microbacterium saccharophilum]
MRSIRIIGRMPKRRRASWWTRRGGYLLVVAAVLATVAVVIAGMRLSPTKPDRPVTISTADWAPYVGEDLPGGGPLAALVRLVLAQQGYQASVDFTTWDLALSRARQGQALAAFPLVASRERAATLLASDPLVDFEYVLFRDTSLSAPDVDEASDLGELRVARIAGYDYWPALDDAVGQYVEFDTSADAFRALAEGAVDLVAEGRVAGETLLNSPELDLDAARFAPLDGDASWLRSTESLRLFVAADADGRRLIEDFNRALADVRLTPEYRALTSSLASEKSGQTVRLDALDGSPVVLQNEAGETLAVLPRGSSAVVLEWPEVFGVTASAALPTRVKITSGPGRGKVGLVDLALIEMEG